MIDINFYLLSSNIYNGIYDSEIKRDDTEVLNQITNMITMYKDDSNQYYDAKYNCIPIFWKFVNEYLDTEEKREVFGKKIYDIIESIYKGEDISNLFKINWYFISLDGTIYGIGNYQTMIDNIDQVTNIGIEATKRKYENKEIHRQMIYYAESSSCMIDKYCGLQYKTTLLLLMDNKIDDNESDILDLVSQDKINYDIRTEVDMIDYQLDKFANDKELNIEYCIIDGVKTDVHEFLSQLQEENVYPDYTNYRKILDTEYEIVTSIGTLKKKKSSDIYNLNYEFIPKE